MEVGDRVLVGLVREMTSIISSLNEEKEYFSSKLLRESE